jgi:phage tail-like protein
MALAARIDPLGAYNFIVRLVVSATEVNSVGDAVAQIAAGGFSECSGIEASLQVEPYRQGGDTRGERRFPTSAAWGNIRLRRGVALSNELWDWYEGFTRGRGRRHDGVIFLQSDLHVPVKVWRFRRGLPVRWAGPTLNAGEGRLAIEELEIAHEGLELVRVA